MKNTFSFFFALALISTFGFGCKFFNFGEKAEKVEIPRQTVVTKEILSERLAAKGIKITEPVPLDKPFPLTLNVTFSTRKDNFLINREPYDDFAAMARQLDLIFKYREDDPVFIEGSNEIYKKITLPVYTSNLEEYTSKQIFVEDFEKLVDDLRNEGLDQIELEINDKDRQAEAIDLNKKVKELSNRLKGSKVDPGSSKLKDIDSVAGGVLNGKAIDLPKPEYPSAAKAVRASGTVNVNVTVDENGNVILANAISGHPLLRAPAEKAARKAKFSRTVLSGKPVKVTGFVFFKFD